MDAGKGLEQSKHLSPPNVLNSQKRGKEGITPQNKLFKN
jgi:hypothetical protein